MSLATRAASPRQKQVSSWVRWRSGVILLMGTPSPNNWIKSSGCQGMTIKNALVDRGYRGRKWIDDTKVEIPGAGKPKDSYYTKQKARKKFCRRASIEPVIGHVKQDHRMPQPRSGLNNIIICCY